MKNSFSLFEIILTLVISSIVIIYSSLFLKELYFENKSSQDIQIKKIDLLSTKIFLERHKNNLQNLKYENNNLYFENRLLLENIKKFEININDNIVNIQINLDDTIEQKWNF